MLRGDRERGPVGIRVINIAWQNMALPTLRSSTVCAWAVFGIIQWMSVYKMIAFTTQHGGIEVSERTSDCPEPNTFKKISHKTQRNAHDLALRIWRCHDEWIGARFFDEGEICKLRLHTVTCFASLYVGKQHRTNNEPPNSIKWPWIEPRIHRKIKNRHKFP